MEHHSTWKPSGTEPTLHDPPELLIARSCFETNFPKLRSRPLFWTLVVMQQHARRELTLTGHVPHTCTSSLHRDEPTRTGSVPPDGTVHLDLWNVKTVNRERLHLKADAVLADVMPATSCSLSSVARYGMQSGMSQCDVCPSGAACRNSELAAQRTWFLHIAVAPYRELGL